MGNCQQCENYTGTDYLYPQNPKMEMNPQLSVHQFSIYPKQEQEPNGPNNFKTQLQIRTYSRITTATSNQETLDLNNQLGNSPAELKSNKINAKQQYRVYQQKISEEAESIVSQLEKKLSKKNSSKYSSKIEPTLISLLNKINNSEEHLHNLKAQNVDFIKEEENNLQENINESISQISLQADEKHELNFALESDDSLINELEEENNLNKAFILYDPQNNLNLSNICNAQNIIKLNARLTYNTSIPYTFSRQISTLSKSNLSNPFISPDYSNSGKYQKNDQILINHMPMKTSNHQHNRINYVKLNYQ